VQGDSRTLARTRSAHKRAVTLGGCRPIHFSDPNLDVWLVQFAPHEPIARYQHNRTGEDNAHTDLKRQVMGREVVVAVTEGRLDSGPWEQISCGEFDGQRKKRVLVKLVGE
jgi:thiamine phosphate synthase YjbQ (UPF0047 family)